MADQGKFATQMMRAFVEAGIVPKFKVRKDGNLRKERNGTYWPRLKPRQPKFERREVR